MLFIYIILGVLLAIIFVSLYCLVMFDKIYLDSNLSLPEFDLINRLVKRELNLSNSKKWGLKELIEKCDTVNNIWSGISKRKNIDITEWAFIFALHYLNQKQFKYSNVKRYTLKQKWKYRHKYIFIYYLKR